jgi:hypothetical protein
MRFSLVTAPSDPSTSPMQAAATATQQGHQLRAEVTRLTNMLQAEGSMFRAMKAELQKRCAGDHEKVRCQRGRALEGVRRGGKRFPLLSVTDHCIPERERESTEERRSQQLIEAITGNGR